MFTSAVVPAPPLEQQRTSAATGRAGCAHAAARVYAEALVRASWAAWPAWPLGYITACITVAASCCSHTHAARLCD